MVAVVVATEAAAMAIRARLAATMAVTEDTKMAVRWVAVVDTPEVEAAVPLNSVIKKTQFSWEAWEK